MKVCVVVAPLFGLFGTITGMIEVFYLLAVTGGGDAKAMAGGVSKAIIPPMAGLAVALIGNFAQQYIKNVKESKIRIKASEVRLELQFESLKDWSQVHNFKYIKSWFNEKRKKPK